MSLTDARQRTLRMNHALPLRTWSVALGTFDANTGGLHLATRTRGRTPPVEEMNDVDEAFVGVPVAPLGDRVLLAAISPEAHERAQRGLYDGKLEAPALWSLCLPLSVLSDVEVGSQFQDLRRDQLLAAWDLGAIPSKQGIIDRGPGGHHGSLVNLPARAVTGVGWTPDTSDFVHAPDAYRAVHFHSDDVGAVGWSQTAAWQIPEETPSGVYAARVRQVSSGAEELLPFVVTPKVGSPGSDVLVVLPTATYLAYANDRLPIPAAPDYPRDQTVRRDPRDVYVAAHDELGKSLYDVHPDGSGWCYSSRLRPMLNMHPGHHTSYLSSGRHLAADMYLLRWLRLMNVDHDVSTDEQLHRCGDDLLDRYKVMITGSHPEYTSGAMLTAIENFVGCGGALVYLGGNGFYWVTAFGGSDLEYIECRRGVAGSRAWTSEPGEYHLSSSGELGGLWRHRGRPPNALVGIGFGAMGAGGASRPYVREPVSYDPRYAWVFEGVDHDTIGAHGLSRGGAAGDELDRTDSGLGTPPDAVVLATADGFSDFYQVAIENLEHTRSGTGGQEDLGVRADLTLLQSDDRGPVFSVGSIAWISSLLTNGGDNDVSRITANVLRRFRADVSKS